MRHNTPMFVFAIAMETKKLRFTGKYPVLEKVQNTDSTVRHTKATESMKSPEKFILFG